MNLLTFSSFKTNRLLTGIQPQQNGSNLQKTAQNLLVHIPGEATGFYLLCLANFNNPPSKAAPLDLWILFGLSFVLLMLVRLLAKASIGVILSSIVAFIIWMFIIDEGIFNVLYGSFISVPWKLVIAAFYTAVITILANAGIIK